MTDPKDMTPKQRLTGDAMYALVVELRDCAKHQLDELEKDFGKYLADSMKYIGHAKTDEEQATQRAKVGIIDKLVTLIVKVRAEE